MICSVFACEAQHRNFVICYFYCCSSSHIARRETQMQCCLHYGQIMLDLWVGGNRLNRCQIYMAVDKILSGVGFEKLTSLLHPVHTALFNWYFDNGQCWSLEADTETLYSCTAGSVRTVMARQAFVCLYMWPDVCVCALDVCSTTHEHQNHSFQVLYHISPVTDMK